MFTNSTRSLLRVCTHVLKYDREMPISRLQVLLIVASDRTGEGVLVRDLMKRTGLNQSTTARILSLLGEKTVRGYTEPLRWVEMRPDPEDPRRVRCHLTEKGATVIAELDELTS